MWWRLDETPYVTKKSRIERNGCGRIGAVFVGHSLKESLHAEDETMRVTVEKLAATEHYAKFGAIRIANYRRSIATRLECETND